MHIHTCNRNAGRKENTWKNVRVKEGIILKWGLIRNVSKIYGLDVLVVGTLEKWH